MNREIESVWKRVVILRLKFRPDIYLGRFNKMPILKFKMGNIFLCNK
jgi:hypothetical protein